MARPGSFLDIIDVVLPPKSKEPWRPHLRPGDACVLGDMVHGDVALQRFTMYETLEREAFSGGSQKNEVTGWIRTGEVALVIAVDDTHVFLWGPQGSGWLDSMALVPLQDIPVPGKGATEDPYRRGILGAV